MLYDVIKNFNKQFDYEPIIENKSAWRKFDKFIIAGMGGSHLAADLVKIIDPNLDVLVHTDYGLPQIPETDLKSRLLIASSYSGNTEETLDAYDAARAKGLSVTAVSVGGKLLADAKKDGIPYVVMPDTGIQPRSALGYSLRAILKLMGEEKLLAESSGLAYSLDPGVLETAGAALAERLRGFIPIIYSSSRNAPLALNWKIKINETAKIPAFYNVFPELNHNEMTGFDPAPRTKELSRPFYFILLKDAGDHPRVQKRMEVMDKIFRKRGFVIEPAELQGKNTLEKIFSALVLADWVSYYLAEFYNVDSEQVPMVEEFKKLINE